MATSTIEKVTNNTGNRYCKMPDGTLIQWGQDVVATQANTLVTKTVEFPMAFSNVNFYAISINVMTSDNIFMNASGFSLDKAIVNCTDKTSTTRYFSWIAVGRWK